jgi:DNA-nicking Smr family endonuclease
LRAIIRESRVNSHTFINQNSMASKKSPPGDNDAELFHEMMDGIRPLSQDRIDPDSTPKKRAAKQSAVKNKTMTSFGELEYVSGVDADESLSFSRNGVQQKLMTKLKKGQFAIESKIDLHGLTVNEAGARLQHALEAALANHYRCVLVVHGRGKGSLGNKPAIKTHVNQWLRESSNVLAFHSAQAHHGGTGALYVLLKRQRDNDNQPSS